MHTAWVSRDPWTEVFVLHWLFCMHQLATLVLHMPSLQSCFVPLPGQGCAGCQGCITAFCVSRCSGAEVYPALAVLNLRLPACSFSAPHALLIELSCAVTGQGCATAARAASLHAVSAGFVLGLSLSVLRCLF